MMMMMMMLLCRYLGSYESGSVASSQKIEIGQ